VNSVESGLTTSMKWKEPTSVKSAGRNSRTGY
jgi:hypothetical protein